MSSDQNRVDAQAGAEGSAPRASGGGLASLAFFLILAAGLGFLAFALLVRPGWLDGSDDLESYPKLGSLSLSPLAANETKLSLADLKGQIVLLNFWGTWCPPCVEEFPHVRELHEEYRDRTDVKVLAVSCGRGADDAKDIGHLRVDTQAFLEHRFVEMPVYLDPDQKTRTAVLEAAAQRVLNLQMMPTTLLLDREHRIRVVWIGAKTKRDFASQIDRLLAEE
jgi:thiol-disulfide isomerase/thioredoxin